MKSLAVRERPDCRVHLENENYANPEVVNLKVHKRWLVAIATVTSLAGSTLAQDVGFVTPKNQFQTELVRQVFDHAFTRCEDKYLVAFDAGQQASLEQSGIEYQILLSGADLDQTYVVRQLGHAEQAKLDVNALDKPLEISAGVYLAAMSQKAAADLTANTGWVATPLSELNIRFYYVPPAVSTMLSTLTDFPTDSLAALVSQDSLYAFDTRLEAFQTRYIWTDSIDRARDWIVQKFLNWGYTNVTTPQFYYYDWHYNVMAVKPGYAEPDKVIVVGGHYDSITYGQSPGPYEYAPGADDNASGTSTVMEMARVLANVPLRKTVIFMAFSAEEVGLVGSQAAAQDFVYNGTDIEVMYNFDMVAYTEDTYWDIEVSSGSNKAYRDLAGATASRVTSLIPVLLNAPGNSDHDSFRNQGFNIVNAIEADFNNAGWHTNLDLSSRLNFPYLTDVVKMAVASVAIVANAAHPTFVEDIIDQGDGQSLEVFWSDCDPTYQYSVQYGTSPGVYSDTVIVPAGMCSYTFSGLTEGQAYYFAVVGSAADAYPPVYTVEGSETPYMVPRAPKSFSAGPELNQIVLDWADNREADFSHYRIWRRLDGLDWSLYQDNVTSSSWIDASVVGQVNFNYRVTAVDVSGYESDFSSESGSYAGTFDGGILLVDEISQGAPLPNQATQEAYFDTVFGGTPHALTYVENISQALNRSTAGRYSSIFWFDDDLSSKVMKYSGDSLAWYAGYTDNIFVSGLRTIQYMHTSPLAPGNLLYDHFGLAAYVENTPSDFAGAYGQNGWPSVQSTPTGIFAGKVPVVPKLTPRPGATVIYTFDSYSNNSDFEGQPCGLLYSTSAGYRVLLSFPLYFMTHTSVQSVISHAKTLFGESATIAVNGDVDGSGVVEFVDLIYLIDFLFRGGSAPIDMNTADVDASCVVNVGDVTYFVAYLFLGGAEPLPGCAAR